MISAKDYVSPRELVGTIGQERIFKHYLGLDIDTTRLHKSPLRKDDNPTCSF